LYLSRSALTSSQIDSPLQDLEEQICKMSPIPIAPSGLDPCGEPDTNAKHRNTLTRELFIMRKIADLCRRIQEEPDPKKFAALVNELIRLLDEERAIKTRPAASLHDRSFPQARSEFK
jgi:hypothetical protein